MMNQTLRIAALLLLIGCSTSEKKTEEAVVTKKSGFHLVPGHGTENKPISLFKDGEAYHLFYSTGSDEWGHAISNNLVHWQITSAIEMPGDVAGDIVNDFNNTSDLNAWIAYYSDNGSIKARYSVDGQDWSNLDLVFPENVSGNPKITWYEPTETWIMTVANGTGKISFLSSLDLKSWSLVDEIEIDTPAKTAVLFQVENQWGLMLNIEETRYLFGSFDGTSFAVSSEPQPLDQGVGFSNSILFKSENQTALVGQIEKGILSSIRNLKTSTTFDGTKILSGFPTQNLQKQSFAKKRGKLSLLNGDQSSWFSFPIDSISSTLELVLTNDIGDKATIKYEGSSISIERSNFPDETILMQIDESLSDPILTNALQIDLLLDHQTVELFINEGEVQISFSDFPSKIYETVRAKVDGKEYDARLTVYSISQKPLQ